MVHGQREVLVSRSSSPRMGLMRLLIPSAVTQVSGLQDCLKMGRECTGLRLSWDLYLYLCNPGAWPRNRRTNRFFISG